jgi:hypothetical protein
VVGKERSHLDSYYIRGDRKKEERRRRRRSSWNNKNIKGELEGRGGGGIKHAGLLDTNRAISYVPRYIDGSTAWQDYWRKAMSIPGTLKEKVMR